MIEIEATAAPVDLRRLEQLLHEENRLLSNMGCGTFSDVRTLAKIKAVRREIAETCAGAAK